MLTRTYRRHRPGSSRRAKLSGRDLPGQVKRLEYAWIREHDVAGDPAAGDREDLERVQRTPARARPAAAAPGPASPDARVLSYRSRALHARSIVSCTRSSASWNEPSIR